MHPDFVLLGTSDTRGIIVTAKSDDPRYGFVSRFFAPADGSNSLTVFCAEFNSDR